jgi:hypothetical protein
VIISERLTQDYDCSLSVIHPVDQESKLGFSLKQTSFAWVRFVPLLIEKILLGSGRQLHTDRFTA